MNALFFGHTFGNRYGGNAPWLWGGMQLLGINFIIFHSSLFFSPTLAMKILRGGKEGKRRHNKKKTMVFLRTCSRCIDASPMLVTCVTQMDFPFMSAYPHSRRYCGT
jgi:hypothetical protein